MAQHIVEQAYQSNSVLSLTVVIWEITTAPTGVGQFPRTIPSRTITPGQFPLPFWVEHFSRTIPPICYAYIHTYTCMHIHTHIHTYTHTYTHIHTYIHTYTCIHIHAYIHIQAYIHTYTSVCMYASILCMYVYIYV